jgi:PAS domain S-box-containing protein
VALQGLTRSAAWRYGFALLTVAGAVFLTWALQRLGLEHPPAPFLAAILLTGWYAGTGPVIVALVLSTLGFDYFFLPPLHSIDVLPPSPYLLVFLPFAVLAGWFSAAQQRSARLLEQSRSELEERVAARTAELERVNQELRAAIAEHQVTEGQLRERTAQLDELFDQAPEAIALLDPQDMILRINREFTRLFGYTTAEAVGRPIYELVVPADHEEEARHLRADFLWRGERIDLQTVRQRKDGTKVPVLLVGTSINVAGSPLAAYVMYRDITEAKHLEDELRRSEAYLVAGQRLSHTGSWARRVATGDIYWSEEAFRILGLEPTGSTMRRESLVGLWHPDDRERAEATIAAAIHDKRAYDMEVRIVRPDGSIRYVQTRGQPMLDQSGEVIELMGVIMDVTDRKRAERALRRARERTMEARFAAVLDERTRLAREIHDTLLQGFTGVALQLLAATSRVTGPPEVIPKLRDLVTLAQKTLEDARRAVWDMRSPSLGGGNFSTALRATAEDALRGSGLDLEFGTEGVPRPLDPDVETVVLRVLQEAIANIVKHAAARQVRVGLSYEARSMCLSVTDDGRGFAMDPDVHTYGGHWGLLGMRERASQVRAKLSVQSTPGHGTKIVLLAPYTPRPQSRNPGRP